MLVASVAFGEVTTCVWKGADGGVWTDTANWSGDRPPQTSEDVADFGTFIGTVGFSTGVSTYLGGLNSSGGRAVVNLNGGTFNLGGNVPDCAFAGAVSNGRIAKYGPNAQTFSGEQAQTQWNVLGGTMAFDLETKPLVHYAFDDAADLGADSGMLGKRLDGIRNVSYFNDTTRGGCARFDASSLGALYASDAAGLPGGSSPFTISLWVRKISQWTYWTFTSWGNPSPALAGYWKGNRLNMRQGSIRHGFCGGESDIPLAGTGFSFGDSWNHVAVTFDGANRKLYVNGAFAADMSDGSSAQTYTTGTVLCLGCFSEDGTVAKVTDGFGGDMDDVMIFGSALNAQDVKRVYEGTKISRGKIPATAEIVAGMGAAVRFANGEQTLGSIEGPGDLVLDDARVTVAPEANAQMTVGRILGAGTLVKEGAGTLTVARAAECGGELELEAGEVDVQGGGISLDDPRLVAYWKFDDRQDPGKDSGPHGMTLAPSGTSTWNDHLSVGGMSVYNGIGANGALHFADSASKEFLPGSTFTVAMWLKPKGDEGYTTIWQWGTTDAGYNKFNRLRFNTYNVLAHSQNSGVDLNHTVGNDVFLVPVAPKGWHHVAITADAASRKMYLDGELIESINTKDNGAGACGKDAEKTDITLGCFTGYYDEVAIFNNALSVDEIRQVAAGIGSSGSLSVIQQAGTKLVLKGGELAVGDAQFAGEVSGEGTLSLAGRVSLDASAAVEPNGLKFSENATLVFGEDSPAIVPASKVALPTKLNVELDLSSGTRDAVVDLLSCPEGFTGSTDGWTGIVRINGLVKPRWTVSFVQKESVISAKVSAPGLCLIFR